MLEDSESGPPPYWTLSWPSGHALAALLEERDLRGVRVLELGCGLGLPSLVAQRDGAEVLATDNEREALALLRRNARRVLHHPMRTLLVDVLVELPEALVESAPFDLVLAGDVLYRSDLRDAFAAILPQLVAPGGEALIAFAWPGQADSIAEALAARGWDAAIEPLPAPAPGERAAHLLSLRAPAA
jgi:predicted nicotinamide N-methyase